MAQYNLPGSPVFMDEQIDVLYAHVPLHEKTPGCPDGFVWRGEAFEVEVLLSEWKDFSRRGRLERSLRPARHARAMLTGRWARGASSSAFELAKGACLTCIMTAR